MGYELRRRLREALGPEIKGMPRAVALEIADDANDNTRESFAALEDLKRWTAAKDTNVVRDALKRLAAAGWEFRVPIGKGKDGRLLYAVPGTRMTFRVPIFEGVVTTTPLAPEGVVTTPSEGVTTPSEGVTTTPFSSSPQISSTTAAGKPAGGQQEQQRKPNKHQVADDLTKAFWKLHGEGRAQPFLAVRSVIRAAIGNGVERDDLARALDQVAREGRSISGATLDIALGKLRGANGQQRRGGVHRDIPDHDDFNNGNVKVNL